MIQGKDRSGWFGASDTSFVVGNRNTATFKQWWLEKLGLRVSNLNTKPMRVGTNYEHKILDTIPKINKDKQILIPDLRLRVNLDGDKNGIIYEVKTHMIHKPFKVTKGYWRQAQVEMFSMNIESVNNGLYIVSYALTDDDYKNYFNEIDKTRLEYHLIEYDQSFIDEEYLPNLIYLRDCLLKGKMPNKEPFKKKQLVQN